MNEKFLILIRISNFSNFFRGPIHNDLAFVQMMAWCQAGNKPLPETMLTQLT